MLRGAGVGEQTELTSSALLSMLVALAVLSLHRLAPSGSAGLPAQLRVCGTPLLPASASRAISKQQRLQHWEQAAASMVTSVTWAGAGGAPGPASRKGFEGPGAKQPLPAGPSHPHLLPG